MIFIIGIDPGKSLGIAVMQFPALINVYQGDSVTGTLWLRNILDVITAFDILTEKEPKIYVAIERFIITPGTGRRSHSGNTSALVGRIQEIVEEYSTINLYMQSVSDASRFNNNLLRKLGLYVTASRVGCLDANDVNSAVRHILLCLARNRADLFTQLVGDLDWT